MTLQPAPRVRLISTGSEITQGLYADTNAQRLSVLLFETGFRVTGHAAAPDDREAILSAIVDASTHCDLIIMTGGLGPTEDDLNRDIVAQWAGCDLRLDAKAEGMIRDRFARAKRQMPEQNLCQALVPAQAEILYNHWGTAPGFFLPPQGGRPALMALPGPPSEWKPMFAAAAELLTLHFPGRPQRAIYSLHLAMIPESAVNQKIDGLFHGQQGCELTILASRGHIRLRIIATGIRPEDNAASIKHLRDQLVERLGEGSIFHEGPGDATLAEGLVTLLKSKGKTIVTAESCTGGWVAKELTDVAGSSEVYNGGWVPYSNNAKSRDLSVAAAVIERSGAVSKEVVTAMAENARRISNSDFAIAISGIAGPGGGSEEKPVGTVWFAVAGPDRTLTLNKIFVGDRETVRSFAVIQSLELIRRAILGWES